MPTAPSLELNELMLNLTERRSWIVSHQGPSLLLALAKVVTKEYEKLGNVMDSLQQEEHSRRKYRTTDEPLPYTSAYGKEGYRWVIALKGRGPVVFFKFQRYISLSQTTLGFAFQGSTEGSCNEHCSFLKHFDFWWQKKAYIIQIGLKAQVLLLIINRTLSNQKLDSNATCLKFMT